MLCDFVVVNGEVYISNLMWMFFVVCSKVMVLFVGERMFVGVILSYVF